MKRDPGQEFAAPLVPGASPIRAGGPRQPDDAAPPARAACAAPPAAIDDVLDRTAHARLAAATGGLSPASALLAWLDWGMHMAVSPGKAWALAAEAVSASLETLPEYVPGWSPASPGADEPADNGSGPRLALPEHDPRFADARWQAWPFSAHRRAFWRVERWWEHATTGVRGVDAHHEQLVQFFARQWVDAIAPSNFVAANPRVLSAACSTGGANFAFGARNWLEDFAEWIGYMRGVSGKPKPVYRPGADVATTPGKVVFRNELCELLQYAPTTPHVAREPVLIVPSWIMKYYILDLQTHDSLVRYLVNAGFTVFMISWRNPVASDRDLELDDYLTRGLLAALDVVQGRCPGERVQAVGYCLGGTLLAMAAAALARDARTARDAPQAAGGVRTQPLAGVTLLAALTDFSEPGELGLFIDESELAALDALMWEQGYLDGSQMAAAFQLVNARDLIWSRMMSEYLLGRRSKPNDLMSWNQDTTRMPYRMHSEYLTRLFLHNDLAEGRYCIGGRPIALFDIEAPLFVVGTERDHVSPWRSVYKLQLLTHHALTFLLTSGGHNAGIVSEPGHAGRHFRIATRGVDAPYRSPDEFVEDNAPIDGSWWPCWAGWLHSQASGETTARALEAYLPDAPGSYVHEP